MAFVRCSGAQKSKVPNVIYEDGTVLQGAFSYNATNSFQIVNTANGYLINSTGNSPSTVEFFNTTNFTTDGHKKLTLMYTRTGTATTCTLNFANKTVDIPVSANENVVEIDVTDVNPNVPFQIRIINNTGASQSSYLTMKYLAFTS